MPRLPEGVVVACIAALSALAGTLVGAIVTYEGNRQLQNRQVHQEEARQAKDVRAIARLLMYEYEIDSDRLFYMIEDGEYNTEIYREQTFVSHVDPEDHKLLAGSLSERDWLSVARASRKLAAVQASLEVHHGRGEIGSEEHKQLEEARYASDTALTALTPLADGAAG